MAMNLPCEANQSSLAAVLALRRDVGGLASVTGGGALGVGAGGSAGRNSVISSVLIDEGLGFDSPGACSVNMSVEGAAALLDSPSREMAAGLLNGDDNVGGEMGSRKSSVGVSTASDGTDAAAAIGTSTLGPAAASTEASAGAGFGEGGAGIARGRLTSCK